jgi:RNA recognition motif-containing protein
MTSKESLEEAKVEELKRKIFVGGLLKNATEEQLESYFGKFGKIKDILVNRSSKSGACKGCAFIVFEQQSVAEALISDPNFHEIGGKMVEVKSCHVKGTKPKGQKSLQYSESQSTMPSPMVQNLGVSEISPLVLCTPLNNLEFVALEDLAQTPKVEKTCKLNQIKKFESCPEIKEKEK